MNPLLAIALGLLPDLVRLLAGDRNGTLANKIVTTVKDVTKSSDEAGVQKAVAEDPAVRSALQKQLADIALEETKEQNRADEAKRSIELDVLKEQYEEAARAREDELNNFREEMKSQADARAFYSNLAQSQPIFAWINPALSVTITLGFMGLVYALLFAPGLKTQDNQVFNIALGAFATAFATVIGFHFGSSSGSKEKDMINKAVLTEAVARREEDRIAEPPSPRPTLPSTGTKPAPRPDVPMAANDQFAAKAPMIIGRLMADFDLTLEQACGVLGNAGHECNGFRSLQEMGVKPPRGGWGWFQWTGPRRRNFENWAQMNGLAFASDDANYGFLKQEWQSTERQSLEELRKARSIEEAARSFMEQFERPGKPNLTSRIQWSKRAAAAWNSRKSLAA
jgi:hypothetical protein